MSSSPGVHFAGFLAVTSRLTGLWCVPGTSQTVEAVACPFARHTVSGTTAEALEVPLPVLHARLAVAVRFA